MTAYYGGLLSFSDDKFEAVLRALNLLVSKNCPVVVGHARVEGSTAALPIAVKCADKRDALASVFGGCSLKEVEEVFKGARLETRRITPNVEDKAALDLARELELASGARKAISMGQIRPASEEGERPFSRLLGMDEQATRVAELLCAAKTYGRDAVCLHALLLGNPGCGKTSFAREFHALGHAAGVLPGELVEARADDLIAPYVGQTAGLVRAAWERARGGMLFVDEAYKLCDTAEYGLEAVNALNELMEAERDEVVLVAAGYPAQMERFLGSNPGLVSRFPTRLAFADYGPETLARIVEEAFAPGVGVSVAADVHARLGEACRALTRGPDYANARSARRLFGRWLVKQATLGGGETLTLAALEAALAEEDLAVGSRLAIGFS